ncbi:MAG: TatD family hydrolase [Bryobacteraceae bacterium]
MTLVDSHCHLDDAQFDTDRESAIARAVAAGVRQMLAIGTGEGPPDLEAAIRLAEQHAIILATVGIHPQYALKGDRQTLDRIPALLQHPKVVALGEIGLDYHYQPIPKEEQHAIFIEQMAMAHSARKPIIIHTRDAWDDTYQLLKQHWYPTGLPCILHCFTGGPAQAKQALELDCYVSFAGIATYPKATEVQESAKLIPLHRLLVETDSPYLPPVPFRGKRNEPANVVHTARRLAEIRGEDFEWIAAATTSNFQRLCLPALKGNGYTGKFHGI